MPSAFDLIDKQHRPKDPVKLEPLKAGEECPNPRCRGRMEWAAGENATGTVVLACDYCGWEQRR